MENIAAVMEAGILGAALGLLTGMLLAIALMRQSIWACRLEYRAWTVFLNTRTDDPTVRHYIDRRMRRLQRRILADEDGEDD